MGILERIKYFKEHGGECDYVYNTYFKDEMKYSMFKYLWDNDRLEGMYLNNPVITYKEEYKRLREENENLKTENKTLKETIIKLAIKI